MILSSFLRIKCSFKNQLFNITEKINLFEAAWSLISILGNHWVLS